MEAKLTIHEHGAQAVVHELAELDAVVAEATSEALRASLPNIIFVEVPNGNSVSMVVGAPDTVLCFSYAHQNPPYYVSKGAAHTDEPVLTAFVALEHRTEYPRRWVIPLPDGMRALHEFVATGNLPTSIAWEEP